MMVHFYPNLGPNVRISSYQYLLKEFFYSKIYCLKCTKLLWSHHENTKNWYKLCISTVIWTQSFVALTPKNDPNELFEIWVYLCSTKFMWIKCLGHFCHNLASKLCMFGYTKTCSKDFWKAAGCQGTFKHKIVMCKFLRKNVTGNVTGRKWCFLPKFETIPASTCLLKSTIVAPE